MKARNQRRDHYDFRHALLQRQRRFVTIVCGYWCVLICIDSRGYGTFSEPVARAIAGTLYAFDIEPLMVERTRRRTDGLPVVCESRDVSEAGFGVSVDAVLLFNILHCERPIRLLRHAAAAAPTVLVTHWRHGQTPRGPSLDIRPRPEQVAAWAVEVGLQAGDEIELPPWHYGLELARAPAV